MSKKRMVVVPIQDLVRILGNYTAYELVPEDSQPVKIMVNPKSKGKIGILIESPGVKEDMHEVKFDLRRVYSV